MKQAFWEVHQFNCVYSLLWIASRYISA